MKKLKAETTDIRIERRREAVDCQTSPIKNHQPIFGDVTTNSTSQHLKMGWQRLTAQVERINQLSAELETAMFELKAIANDVNARARTMQTTQQPISSVCEYLKASVPCVRRKKAGAFVLTNRAVDLFQAEREAAQVAQELRCRAKKRRRVLSLLSRRKKRLV